MFEFNSFQCDKCKNKMLLDAQMTFVQYFQYYYKDQGVLEVAFNENTIPDFVYYKCELDECGNTIRLSTAEVGKVIARNIAERTWQMSIVQLKREMSADEHMAAFVRNHGLEEKLTKLAEAHDYPFIKSLKALVDERKG